MYVDERTGYVKYLTSTNGSGSVMRAASLGRTDGWDIARFPDSAIAIVMRVPAPNRRTSLDGSSKRSATKGTAPASIAHSFPATVSDTCK